MKDLNDIEGFAEFLRGEKSPPPSLEASVVSSIHRRLNPSAVAVVIKLFLFHALGSLVTLLFCPQFGVSLTGKSLLMPYLMEIHPAVCFFSCGIFWMLIGQVLSYLFLTLDEHRVVGNSEWGLGFAIMALSLLFFGCVGRVHFNDWLIFWSAGALAIVALFNARLSWERRKLRLLGITAWRRR